MILPTIITLSLLVQVSEGAPEPEAPKIFIDCDFLDKDFIKTEMPYLNYVIERKEADIYILITAQTTAGEGTEYTIFFTGQNDFSGMYDTLKYSCLKSDSDDIIRRGILKQIKLGLVRYLMKTPVAENLTVSIQERKTAQKPRDPWHNWVFNIGVNTYLNGQQKLNFNTLNTTFSVDRVLEKWKIQNYLGYYYTYNIYQLEDTTITNISKSYDGSTKIVLGLNNHFSAGGYASFYSSTYQNIYLSSGIAPAIEYDFFPYDQSSSRKLTLLYDIGYVYFEYYETTIYDKLKERLFKESVSLGMSIIQRWGRLNNTLKASHYFHDFTKNRVTLYTDM